jgi:hypothetical protein
MPVSGYEQHTWQCSACLAVEQRTAFNRDATPTQTAPIERTQSVSAEPTQGVSGDGSAPMPAPPTEKVPVELTEPAPIAPTQTTPVNPIQTLPVEPDKTVAIKPTQPELRHPPLPAAMAKTSAWAKAMDEKLRNLKEQSTAAKEAAGKTARPTQFNRDWNNEPPPVPPPPASSEASSHVKPEEPIRSPTQHIAFPTPTSHDDRVAPESNAPAARKLRDKVGELVRNIRGRAFSKVR